MSFADAGAGRKRGARRAGGGGGGGGGGPGGTGDKEALRVQIQGNLERMGVLLTDMKSCNARIGKKKDTDQSRQQLQDAAEEAKLLREEMVQLFKQFRAAGGSKAMQDKLIRDFQSLNKKMLETTKQTQDLMGQHPSTAGPGGGGMGAAIAGGDEASKPLLAEDNFEETQQQSRLQNNEDQIMQRDKAIQDIESTVADVAEIMQDLAVVVHSQDDLIDNIESAVDRTVDQTKAANTELVKAEGYQKKSRKIVCCIFPILVVVVGAIIAYAVIKDK